MEANTKFCQSCAMPLQSLKEYGSNHDGSPNEEYCIYCYKDGAFTADASMEEMIRQCAPFMVQAGACASEEEAIAQMNAWFPQLKRWAK